MTSASCTGPILGISGSLRRGSINSAALRAAARVAARNGVAITIDDSPRFLPHFDPDLEHRVPVSVENFRQMCSLAAGLLLAVPEYTFGIPGTLKNALDWVVASGSLYRKPVALLHVSAPGRGTHVRNALADVLRAHNADATHHCVLVTPRDLDLGGEITDARILDDLRSVVTAFWGRASARRAA